MKRQSKKTRKYRPKPQIPKLPHRDDVRVIITPQVLSDVSRWMYLAGINEINGTGAFQQDGDDYIFETAWLNCTISSFGSVTQPGNSIAKRLLEGMEAGYSVEELNLHWHTHMMRAYWSSTDQHAVESHARSMPLVNVCFGSDNILDATARIDVRDSDGTLSSYSVATVFSMPQEWLDELNTIRKAVENGENIRRARLLDESKDDHWYNTDWFRPPWFQHRDDFEPDDGLFG